MKSNSFFSNNDTDLLTVKSASVWASSHLKRNVTTSNISYLVQYGRIKNRGKNGQTNRYFYV